MMMLEGLSESTWGRQRDKLLYKQGMKNSYMKSLGNMSIQLYHLLEHDVNP